MTSKQIEWASRHDWFVKEISDGVVVRDRVVDKAGNWSEYQFLWTGTFRELRDWAGY